MNNKLKEIISPEEICSRVKKMGETISSDYLGKELILISVLRGSVYFAVDLSRSLSIPFSIDFISISRYGGNTEPAGVVRITKNLDVNIGNKDVLIVEDIVDTGLSLSYLLQNLKTRNPKTLKVCTFLNVESRRIVNVPVDYKGFDLPDIYVVGYGLDHDEQYRGLPFVAEFVKT
ncbi:hypoxanthine phosphoribosyltransferase [Candidatus Contubernalis alkaliaceticus]|uniref:hypoxanthine phosphoribosyltransferase n=1 Tax=Candidatus Contubernalis alkaliaceticus TaxID=338645 RepID=UPI001F4C4BA8|nr:hypoxanthine phosphoribosyltransferase [Candidatus Contubernalis alkalaceticus]UNC92690.1 hypoxanthine phosphoribosyltransferase [Candidatus Contubernalis alkalaceticus]